MTKEIQGFRLSPQQRELWAVQQGQAFAAQCVLRLEGQLDRVALRTALQAVVERHDVLRTTFHRTAGVKVPVQSVAPMAPNAVFSWQLSDWSALDPAAREAAVEELLAREAQQLDLENGPTLRTVLATESSTESVLVLTLPALCADTWTLHNLVAEIGTSYGAALGDSSERPEGAENAAEDIVQYLQFAEWLNELLVDEDADAGREYWRKEDGMRGPGLVLPMELEPGEPDGFVLHRAGLTLESGLAERLAAFCVAREIRLDVVLLACWQLLLQRLTGAGRVVVAMVAHGRKYGELKSGLGLFSRWLPVALAGWGELPLEALVERLGQGVAAHENAQEYFEWSGEDLPAAEFPIGFEHERRPGHRAVAGLGLCLSHLRAQGQRFKLKLHCVERRGTDIGLGTGLGLELGIEVEGDAALFDPADLLLLASRFAALLASAVGHPEQPSGELEILAPEERRALLVDFNATAVPIDLATSIQGRFEAEADRDPAASAIELQGERLTYAELDLRANRLAHHLRALGVGPDVLVGIGLERSADLVVAILATLKAGGAYLPLDPAYPDERLAFMLAETRTPVLLIQEVSRERFAGLGGFGAAATTLVCLDGDGAAIAARSAARPERLEGPDNLAYVIYTSGSTGRPKGAMITHRGLLNYLTWAVEAYGVAERPAVPVHSPVSFDLTVTSLFTPLLCGRTVVLIAEDRGIEGLATAMRDRGGFSLLKLTPAHLVVLTQWLQPEQAVDRAAALVIGGEALQAEALFFWRAHAPGTRLFNEYGPTETVVGCTLYEVPTGVSLAGPVPIGRPIANTQAYVLDPHGIPVPGGLAGELHIGGAGLARGYLGRPDLTAERFVPAPYCEPGGRLYRTGDQVRLGADGNLHYLGRRDDQVKVRGFRIELGEVEAALAAHESVRESAVRVREDTPGDRRLVGYVVAQGNTAPGTGELRDFLLTKLPAYMVPAAFVLLPALPLTANGKVDRAALPAPGVERPDLEQAYVAPDNETEEVLAAVMGQILGLSQVGIHDNFFVLGGDSMRSVQIVALARERGIEFSVEDLFRHQTIRQLAEGIQESPRKTVEVARVAPWSLLSAEDRGQIPSGIEDAYPLTRLQSGMIYHMDLTADRPAFHNVNTWHIRARFDPRAFQRAVDALVARHRVMRTAFDLTHYTEPLQLVHERAALEVPVEDLRHLSAAEQEVFLADFWARENRAHFDLAEPPLVRYFLHRRSDDTFQFTLTELHTVLDGWSTTSNISEIFSNYFAVLRGEEPEETPLAVEFRDYVAAERRAIESEESRRFWAQRLEGSSPTLLPRWPAAFRGRPSDRVEKLMCPIPEQVFAGLRQIAWQQAVPLKSVLLAAQMKVLGTLCGESDVVTGVIYNGRPEEPDGARIRGLFLNILPVRVELSGGTWAELVRTTFEAERELIAYRLFPLTEVQKIWGGHDLSETLFNYLNFHSVDDVLKSGEGEILDNDEIDFSYTNFTLDTCFFWIPLSMRLLLLLEYDPDKLCREQVERFQLGYLRVLAAMAADPAGRYDTLSLLSGEEERQVLSVWNETATDYPRELAVHQLFARVAARQPAAPALRFDGRSLTYGELDGMANQLAHHLRSLGVRSEVRVGVCLERSWEMMLGFLAVLKAGGAYLPLDPSHPVERRAFMLEDARATVLLTRSELAGALAAVPVRTVSLDTDWAAIAAQPSSAPSDDAGPDHLVYVIYTSGSTGRPKGVAVQHRGVLHLVVDTHYVGFGPDDVVAQSSNASFDTSTFEIWGALLNGGCLVGIPRAVMLSPLEYSACIRAEGITIAFITPALFNEVVRQAPETFRGLRYVVVGGDVVDPRWSREVLAKGAPEALLNGYGPTEVTTFGTWYPISEVPEGATSIPIGRPISNTQAYILDDAFLAVPVGSPGELFIGGDGVARGYLNQSALTASRFVPDPYGGVPGARLYRTGDLSSFLPDGNIEFMGRRDQQAKIRGFRVEPGEIEAALKQHPEVLDSAVVLVEPVPGDRRLVAYLVLQERPGPSEDELRAFLRRDLPEYMIPWTFMPLDALPLTPNGKVDRRALPAPPALRPELADTYVAPRNDIEEILAAVWAQVLGVDRVGIHDDFFVLGGDSIVSLRLVALARQRGANLTIEQLFSHPSIAALGLLLGPANAGMSAAPVLAPFSLLAEGIQERLPAGIVDAYPLTRLQLGMLYHMRLHPESPAYHNVSSWHLKGPFAPELLRQSVARAVARHPALRTSFDLTSHGEPLQLVHDGAVLPVVADDLRGLPAAEIERQLAEFLASEHQSPFDLARPPLARYHLHRRSDDSFQFTITECHAITDGWSTTSTLADVFADYLDLVHGATPAERPALVTTFREFVALERQALASEESRAYWEKALAGAVPASPTPWPPTGRPAGTVRAHKRSVTVSGEVRDGLRGLARAEAVPLKSVLLAAHVHALGRLSGQRDVLTGMTANGRPERLDGGSAHGLFLNTLPFRLALGGGTFRDLVREVLAAERDSLPFRRFPLAALQKSRGRQAIVETNFNYVNFRSVGEVLGAEDLELIGGDERDLTFSNFALGVTFALDPVSGELRLELEFDAARYGTEQAQAIEEHYLETLRAMGRAPAAHYGELDLLPASERRRLAGWNDTGKAYAGPFCLHRRFEEQAARAPGTMAVIFEGESLTYRQLNSQANRLAHRLRERGVGAGVLVGICAERSLELIVGLLAILKAGGAYVPLEPSYPRERLAFLLGDSQARVLLVAEHLLAALPEVGAEVIPLTLAVAAAGADSLGEENLSEGAGPDDLAYVIYTSGSTGEPKGAMNTHRAVVNRLLWMQEAYGLEPDDRIVQKTPFSFDVSVWELFWPLLTGARLVVARPGGHLDSGYLLRLIEDLGVTTAHFVPSMLSLFLVARNLQQASGLRRVVCSGEALPAELERRFFAGLPGVALHNLYGPTEAAVDVTAWTSAPGSTYANVPIGSPIANTRIHVLDDDLREAPIGVAGELYIGGVQLARGYLHRPALTAERFVPNPVGGEAGMRLYRTGDLARFLPDGPIEFLGRADHQVKLHGMRIELGEIEATLAGHPAVREAVAQLWQAAPGDQRLVAYLVPVEEEISGADLRAYLRAKLPEPMVPSIFVALAELPLNANGKVDRRALPAPGGERPQLADSYAAPGNDIEERLVGLWQEVLRLDRVGVRDNFFDLGGDSLLLLQAHGRLEVLLGREVPLLDLFEYPTIGALAVRLLGHADAAAAPAEGEDFAPSRDRLRRQLALSRAAAVEAEVE